jgi:hypothetical protein
MPGPEGFLGVLGRIAGTFVGGQPNAHQFVWNAIAPWVNELTRAATTHWLPVLVQGIQCEVIERDAEGIGIRCPSACIAACGVCHKPCCLDHSFVSKSGAAVCYGCAQRASATFDPQAPAAGSARAPDPSPRPPPRQSPPKPPPADTPPHQNARFLAEARKVLGVKKSATLEEILTAYRALARRYHPDNHATGNQAQFVRVTAARDLLVKAKTGSTP